MMRDPLGSQDGESSREEVCSGEMAACGRHLWEGNQSSSLRGSRRRLRNGCGRFRRPESQQYLCLHNYNFFSVSNSIEKALVEGKDNSL